MRHRSATCDREIPEEYVIPLRTSDLPSSSPPFLTFHRLARQQHPRIAQINFQSAARTTLAYRLLSSPCPPPSTRSRPSCSPTSRRRSRFLFCRTAWLCMRSSSSLPPTASFPKRMTSCQIIKIQRTTPTPIAASLPRSLAVLRIDYRRESRHLGKAWRRARFGWRSSVSSVDLLSR